MCKSTVIELLFVNNKNNKRIIAQENVMVILKDLFNLLRAFVVVVIFKVSQISLSLCVLGMLVEGH